MPPHEAEPEEAYSIIREKRFSCKPSTVDEAILEMNMLGHTFFLFRDADTMRSTRCTAARTAATAY